MVRKPTENQLMMHKFFLDFCREKQVPPTVREVMVGIGVNSTNGVVEVIKALLHKGLLKEIGGECTSRKYLPLLPGGECVFCGAKHEEIVDE